MSTASKRIAPKTFRFADDGLIPNNPDLPLVLYPPSGHYDLCRGSRNEHGKALAAIAEVPRPATDPIYGHDGRLVRLWPA